MFLSLLLAVNLLGFASAWNCYEYTASEAFAIALDPASEPDVCESVSGRYFNGVHDDLRDCGENCNCCIEIVCGHPCADVLGWTADTGNEDTLEFVMNCGDTYQDALDLEVCSTSEIPDDDKDGLLQHACPYLCKNDNVCGTPCSILIHEYDMQCGNTLEDAIDVGVCSETDANNLVTRTGMTRNQVLKVTGHEVCSHSCPPRNCAGECFQCQGGENVEGGFALQDGVCLNFCTAENVCMGQSTKDDDIDCSGCGALIEDFGAGDDEELLDMVQGVSNFEVKIEQAGLYALALVGVLAMVYAVRQLVVQKTAYKTIDEVEI